MTALVLASTSPYRRQLLDRLHVPYVAVAPACDEDALKRSLALPPAELALALARAKAESLRARYPEHVILGGDQLVELDGEALGKPGDRANALAQLTRMEGRTHSLWTALVLLPPGRDAVSHVDEHRMTMAKHTPEALARYVDREQPFDCAGSYKIESLGIALFERVAGQDFTAIMGLPLLALARLLRGLGVHTP